MTRRPGSFSSMLRRSITFETRRRPRRRGEITQLTLRLFWMDDLQAKFFAQVQQASYAAGVRPMTAAADAAHAMVLHFLQGKVPAATAPATIQLGRGLFPVLTDTDVENLPRAGAPKAPIPGVVLQLNSDTGDKRLVRLSFTTSQRTVYNRAVETVQKTMRSGRDEAWLTVNTLVGRAIAGGELQDDAHEVVRELAGAFPAVDLDGLPNATEEDSRDLSFTTEPQIWIPRIVGEG